MWNEALRESIGQSGGRFSRIVVLAAQIEFSEGEPSLTRIPVRWDWLRESGLPIGAAVRIGAYPGPFDPEAPATILLRTACAEVIAAASKEGVALQELQIDFDSPESDRG